MIKYILTLSAVLLALTNTAFAKNPQVVFQTNQGNFTVELYPEKAPNTVKNFLSYVKSGYYEKTIFHRVIKQFMIQGGGFNADMSQKETKQPIKNEANNGLRNETGSIAMARTGDPHSATSQFFININHNNFLDYRGPSAQNIGYCVFGKVITGMDVVFNIGDATTQVKNGHADVPIKTITVQKITISQ